MKVKLSKHTYQRLNIIACFAPTLVPYFDQTPNAPVCKCSFMDMKSLIFTREETQVFLLFQKIYRNLSEPFEVVFKNAPEISDDPNEGMLSPSAELTRMLKSQEVLPEESISMLSYNAFSSFRDSAIFFYRFMEIENTYNLSECLRKLSPKYLFLSETQTHLEFAFLTAPRAIPSGLKASILQLSCYLQRIVNQDDQLDQDFMNKVVIECMDIYTEMHKLYTSKRYRLPSRKEQIRRENISRTKLAQNVTRQKRIKEIISEIQQIPNAQTSKNACDIFFQQHHDDLTRWGIHSTRTLENLCSHTRPNQRRKESNSVDASQPIFDEHLLTYVTKNLPGAR